MRRGAMGRRPERDAGRPETRGCSEKRREAGSERGTQRQAEVRRQAASRCSSTGWTRSGVAMRAAGGRGGQGASGGPPVGCTGRERGWCASACTRAARSRPGHDVQRGRGKRRRGSMGRRSHRGRRVHGNGARGGRRGRRALRRQAGGEVRRGARRRRRGSGRPMRRRSRTRRRRGGAAMASGVVVPVGGDGRSGRRGWSRGRGRGAMAMACVGR